VASYPNDRDLTASYEAAARGEIPVIRIGGRLRVPVCQLERMLEGIKLTDLAK